MTCIRQGSFNTGDFSMQYFAAVGKKSWRPLLSFFNQHLMGQFGQYPNKHFMLYDADEEEDSDDTDF